MQLSGVTARSTQTAILHGVEQGLGSTVLDNKMKFFQRVTGWGIHQASKLTRMATPHSKKVVKTVRGGLLSKPPAFKYKPQFGIVVVCEDELDQRGTFQMLEMIGFKLKVVCV